MKRIFITGSIPRVNKELPGLLDQIRTQSPPSPRKINPRVPEVLEKIALFLDLAARAGLRPDDDPGTLLYS